MATTIRNTLALTDTVQVAIDFSRSHAYETLILVTGGLTIGFAGTDYDTYLSLLDSQKISFAKFDSDCVSEYKKSGATFDEVLSDIGRLFGLTSGGDGRLSLTAYETSLLRQAYEKSVHGRETGMAAQAEYVAYGTY